MAEGLCACVDRPEAEGPKNAVAAVGHYGRRSVDRGPIHHTVMKLFDFTRRHSSNGNSVAMNNDQGTPTRRPLGQSPRFQLSGDVACPPNSDNESGHARLRLCATERTRFAGGCGVTVWALWPGREFDGR